MRSALAAVHLILLKTVLGRSPRSTRQNDTNKSKNINYRKEWRTSKDKNPFVITHFQIKFSPSQGTRAWVADSSSEGRRFLRGVVSFGATINTTKSMDGETIIAVYNEKIPSFYDDLTWHMDWIVRNVHRSP